MVMDRFTQCMNLSILHRGGGWREGAAPVHPYECTATAYRLIIGLPVGKNLKNGYTTTLNPAWIIIALARTRQQESPWTIV